MQSELTKYLGEWLKIALSFHTQLPEDHKDKIALLMEPKFTFDEIFPVATRLFPRSFIDSQQDSESISADLVTFFYYGLNLFFSSDSLKTYIQEIIDSAQQENSGESRGALSRLWGWIVFIWFVETYIDNQDPFSAVAHLEDSLKTLILESIKEICYIPEIIDPQKTIFLKQHAPCYKQLWPIEEDKAKQESETACPSFNSELRPECKIVSQMNELKRENNSFYTRLLELEKRLEEVCEHNEELERELKKKEERLNESMECLHRARGSEINMCSEVFNLRRQLSAERVVVVRLREKTAWLQVQLFGNGANTKIDPKCFKKLSYQNSKAVNSTFSKQICLRCKHLVKEAAEKDTLKHMQAEIQRYFLALQTAQGRYQQICEREEYWKSNTEKLRRQINQLTSIQAERNYLESELIAQKATNATQFEFIHNLQSKIADLEEALEQRKSFDGGAEGKLSLDKDLHISLKAKIQVLMEEKATREAELEKLQRLNLPELAVEHEALEQRLLLTCEKLKETEVQHFLEKAQVDKQCIMLDRLRGELKEQAEAFGVELEESKKRIEYLQEKLSRLQDESLCSKNAYKDKILIETQYAEELDSKNKQLESMENKCQNLQREMGRLHEELSTYKIKCSMLEDKIENSLNPQIKSLTLTISTMESLQRMGKEDLNMKEFFLKEKEEQITQITLDLTNARQKITELELERKAQNDSLKEYTARAENAESLLKQSQTSQKHLEFEKEALQRSLDQAQLELNKLRCSYDQFKVKYTELESQHVKKLDECKNNEAELSFYRAEFERLTHSTFGTTGESDGSREAPYRQLIEEVRSQLEHGKQELEQLNQTLEERLGSLRVSKASNREFELEDIVEHFEKESSKSACQLRSMTLRLAEAENAYQKLFREHQALGKSHAALLKTYMELNKNASLCANGNEGVKERKQETEVSEPSITKNSSSVAKICVTNQWASVPQDTSQTTSTCSALPQQEFSLRLSEDGKKSNDTSGISSRNTSNIFETITTLTESSISSPSIKHLSSSSSSPVMRCLSPSSLYSGNSCQELAYSLLRTTEAPMSNFRQELPQVTNSAFQSKTSIDTDQSTLGVHSIKQFTSEGGEAELACENRTTQLPVEHSTVKTPFATRSTKAKGPDIFNRIKSTESSAKSCLVDICSKVGSIDFQYKRRSVDSLSKRKSENSSVHSRIDAALKRPPVKDITVKSISGLGQTKLPKTKLTKTNSSVPRYRLRGFKKAEVISNFF